MSRLQKCFNLGTAAPGAAPRRPTNYESGWRGGGVAESRARTCACGATRITAPRGVVIPLECNHFPHMPQRRPNSIREEQPGLPGPETWAARPCPVPAPTRFPPQVGEVSPPRKTFTCGRRFPPRERRGPQKGWRRQRATDTPSRVHSGAGECEQL